MTPLAASWWDSAGAVIVLTGIVTIAAVAIPTALRPWVEGKIHKEQRQEEGVARWYEEARELSIELEVLLEKYEMRTLLSSPAASATLATWDHSLRRRSALVVRFGQTALLNELGGDLFAAIDALHRRALPLCILVRDRPDSSSRPDAEDRYQRFHGEAVYALARFVEALGGPPAPPRAAFTLPLRSDSDSDEYEQVG